jgi:tetratricopeptide (TPR) repeat protein
MKFLNKLFGKGAASEAAPDKILEEAFPAEAEEEYNALQETVGDGDDDAVEAATLDDFAPPAVDEVEASPEPEPNATGPSSSADSDGPSSEWVALRLKLQADPRGAAGHEAVRRAITLRDERIDFYEELASTYHDEIYHSLSLGRAYRAAGQHRDAIPHYQRYLRSCMEVEAFEELAEVYSEVGETYLASSSLHIAQSLRSKGDPCSSS